MNQSKTILAISTCIAGLFFGYFFYHEDRTDSTVQKQKDNVDNQIEQQVVRKNLVVEDSSIHQSKTAAKPATSDRNAAPQRNFAKKTEQAIVKPCSECTERILEFLSDPANSEADKVAACKDWLKPETKDETLSLLRLLKEAHDAQQNNLKDRLLQILAGAESSESAELLLAVINGEMPELVFQEFPEDLQYAIKKGIRLNPESEKIGKALADNYNSQQISPEAAAVIQDVKHPDMIYQLALEADQHGEIEEVRELVQSLQTFADPKTLDVIIRLGKEQVVTEEDAVKSAYAWTNSHRGNFVQDKYEAYLSDSAVEPIERSIAAAALAGAGNPQQALAALKKAADNETDQTILHYYEESIERIGRRISNSSRTGD